MNAPRNNRPQNAPRAQGPIDPLMRLQQLEDRRQQPLPPPTPGTVNRAATVQPAVARQAAGQPGAAKPGTRPATIQIGTQPQKLSPAPRTSAPSANTVLPSGVKPSAQASARIAALAAARGTAGGPGKATANGRPGAKPAGKRAKPAKAAKITSLALSAVTTLGLAGFFAHQNGQTDSIILTQGTLGTTATTAAPTTAATTAPTAAKTTGATTGATAAPTAAPTTAAPTTAAKTGQIVNGTYVGQGSNNRFGTVQVQAVYSGGRLVDVQILQYPDSDGHSLRISQAAIPRLVTESVTAQSAKVNTVSGATYTSKSYRTSLQSAIDAAKAASGL